MSGASIETVLELWASCMRDVKARMRPLFTQDRVAVSADLFVDGLRCAERRKTGLMRAGAAVIRDHGVSRRCSARAGGTRMRCATRFWCFFNNLRSRSVRSELGGAYAKRRACHLAQTGSGCLESVA